MRAKRGGNAGAVESVESQKQAFPSFHEPLGNLANGRRDSHIPTAPTTKADGKVENQKPVSHFPTATMPLEKRTQKPTRRADGAPPLRPATPEKGASARPSQSPKPSGSSRIGTNYPFQAHLALESILNFRLICGLENAEAGPTAHWH
jgi:hypothetical protein